MANKNKISIPISMNPEEEEYLDADNFDENTGLFEDSSDSLDVLSEEDDDNDGNQGVVISKSRLVLMRKLLSNINENFQQLNQIIAPLAGSENEEMISIGQMADENFKSSDEEDGDGRIIEGVFDGENMVGPDGKIYSVPANYASKSKLVEGDILKLTITANGTFIYKQIGPIERSRVVGLLEKNQEGNFHVISDGKKWRVLTASVTYFKGQNGDEAVILVPKAGESNWAAVENIIRNKG